MIESSASGDVVSGSRWSLSPARAGSVQACGSKSTGRPWPSDAEALALLPAALRSRSTKQLVLHRSSRQLILLEQGQLRLRVPAAVGTQGWETPLGGIGFFLKRWSPFGGIPAPVCWFPPEAEIHWDLVGLLFIRTAPIPVVGMARRWCRSAAAPTSACTARHTVGLSDGPCHMDAFAFMTNTSAGSLTLRVALRLV